MYGSLDSLNKYSELMLDYLSQLYINEEDILIDLTEARMAIRHVIDNLIGIELTIEKDDKKLNQYADKFMDLISSDLICDIVPLFYRNYKDYANKQIKKKIRER